MTGPEHYEYAQQLLEMATESEAGSKIERYYLRKAQVHATLALAAATAINPRNGQTWMAWCEVTDKLEEVRTDGPDND